MISCVSHGITIETIGANAAANEFPSVDIAFFKDCTVLAYSFEYPIRFAKPVFIPAIMALNALDIQLKINRDSIIPFNLLAIVENREPVFFVP